MRRVHTTALGRALAAPRYEIVPMRGALEQARYLPAGATVAVTCSPRRGVDATVALAERLAARGYTASLRLAARRVSRTRSMWRQRSFARPIHGTTGSVGHGCRLHGRHDEDNRH